MYSSNPMEAADSTLAAHGNTTTGTSVPLIIKTDANTDRICGTTTLIMDITSADTGFAASDAGTAAPQPLLMLSTLS